MTKVPAEVVWLPSVGYSVITRHFRELLGIDLQIEDESVHSSEEEEESYVTVLGMLKIQLSGLKLLANRWCGQEVSNHQMRLSLEKATILESISINRTLDDKWLEVEDMSFGTIVELNKFAEHYSVMDQNSKEGLQFKVVKINVQFQHDIKLMSVYFHVVKKTVTAKKGSAATHRPHRFEYEYLAIEKVLINTTAKSKSIDVYFYVAHPPLIYIVELPKKAEDETYENYIYQSPQTTYSRIDSFADCCCSNIGLSTVLKLRFSSANSWDAIFNFLLNSEKTKYYFSPIHRLPKKGNYQSPKIKENHFNCIYALHSVLSRNREIVVQIDEKDEIKAVNEKLNDFARKNHKALEAALFEIFFLFERKKLVHFIKALDILFNRNIGNNNNNRSGSLSLPENMTEVRRAILTPTRIIFLPPQPYFKCCFFREFEPEYAIRLSVKDDNIGSLSFTLFGRQKSEGDTSEQHDNSETTTSSSVENASNLNGGSQSEEDPQNNVALTKIRNRLLKGYNIGERHYEWLGCSTSHFREHGVLYYAKDSKGRSAADARRMMGNFDEIKTVPSKYMARLGQVFSQSLDFITVQKSKTIVIEDITTARPNSDKPYVFSDGIGKIAPSIAKEVFEKMKIKHNPSAIQIRYAGCKGMLTQWPGLDKIVFRESMKKFESSREYLDVLKVSKPRLVYLNRPLINILSQLGVPDEVFLDLQNNNLEHYFKSLVCKHVATGVLHVHSALRVDYRRINDAGINVLQEPFFCSMIRNIFQQHLVKLTKKARIQIPEDKGRTMFGVLDETETLKYGQVFVQYTEEMHKEEESAKTVILNNQRVLVTKNPCMHPGDVRKFLAVDVEDLRHIKDCIVFPARGRRPHPDEMAGSDLDGDEFSVIWAEELMFSCDNYDPMDFPQEEPAKLKKEAGVKEMVDFFCRYIRGEQVGQIAAAHLVWAEENGAIFSEKCKNLAWKYSIALDFAKSGGKTEHLKKDERPPIYPDYLEKGLIGDTYISQNVLGQLYRCSKTVLLGFEGLVCTSICEPDEDLKYPGHENYKESAKNALRTFNQEVDAILQQYGIESEGELFSGAILKTSKYTSVKQDLNDLTVIEYRIKKLFKETQKKFCSEFLSPHIREIPPLITLVFDRNREEVFQKASAWYMVTCEQPENGKKYFGFPWTIHEILYEMKNQRGKLNSSTSSNRYEDRMNDVIMRDYQGEINGSETVGMDEHPKILAFKIICDWLDKQPFIINDNEEDKEDYYYFIEKIHNKVADDLENEDSMEELSLFKTVLRYLHKLSLSIFKRDFQCRRSRNSHFFQQQVIGLLAFKTMLNLLYRHEFNPTSLLEGDLKAVEGVFRVPLDDDATFQCICHRRQEFIELLKQWTLVENIELRIKECRRDKWFILFTVKGNKYCLHRFQDVIFQSSFQKALQRI